MKNVSWLLYAVSVVLFLAAGYSKLMGPEHYLFGLAAAGWWRASMALVIYAMALKILGTKGSAVV